MQRCLFLSALLATGCVRHADTPLMATASRGDLAGLEALVRSGTPVDESDSYGHTALIAASRAGRTESIRALIRLGADPNRRGGVNGWTPVMHAIHKAQRNAVAALIEAGADANAKTRRGLTALTMAAGYGDTDTVRLLLALGANPHDPEALAVALTGVPDIDKFTLGDCQNQTVRALFDAAPDLQLPATSYGRWARRLASRRRCPGVP